MLCLAVLKMLPFIKSFHTIMLCAGLGIHTEHTLPHKHASFPCSCMSSPDYAQIINLNKNLFIFKLHFVYAKWDFSAKVPTDFTWKGPCPDTYWISKSDWEHTGQYVHTIQYTLTRIFKCRHREKFFPEIHFHSSKRELRCLPSENRSKPPPVILGIRRLSYLHQNG